MALFSRKKSKAGGSGGYALTEPDEILGYLDEAFRRRVPLIYSHAKKDYETDILLLDSKLNALRIQQSTSLRIPHGSDVSVGFSMDKTWWTFKSKFMLNKEKPYLLVPKSIQHAERRTNQRTNFSAREQVKVTIMEGLGSGFGVFGLARDVSVDGMSVIIERAMNLANEKEVNPSPSLFAKGTRLALVKINKIPNAPLMEVMGTAARVERDGSRWVLGFSFYKLSKTHHQTIARFVEPRLLDFKPTRRSLKRRQEMEAEQGIGSGAVKRGGPAGGSGPAAGAPAAGGAAANGTAAAGGAAASEAESAKSGAKLLVIGPDLLSRLEFLTTGSEPMTLLPGNTPVGIIKMLSEEKPKLMLCGTEFKGRSIFEVLEKIENMGALKQVQVVICAEDLQPKDKIKFKMMKIEHILDLPAAGADTSAFTGQLKQLTS